MNLAESPRLAAAIPRSRSIPAWWRAAKRLVDIAFSATVLAVFALPLGLLMLLVVIVSPGSPLFMQERIGENGRRFRLFKLRTMVDGAHLMLEDVRHLNEVDGPVFKIRNDPRMHVLGPLLRRTSLDEIPNFVNVLIGDMSVVGPRPPLPSEVLHYDEHAMLRLSIKPGITCLWQISGRSNVSFDDWVELDREYIDTWTPWGDLAIIARTVPAVIRGNGAH